MDDAEKALWRKFDCGIGGDIYALRLALDNFQFLREEKQDVADGLVLLNSSYEDCIRDYLQIDASEFDERFPVSELRATQAELVLLGTQLKDLESPDISSTACEETIERIQSLTMLVGHHPGYQVWRETPEAQELH